MEIDVFCITPDEELFAQIRANSASCKRWVKNIEAHDGAAVLVGGGPSLRGRLIGIRARQEHGQKIFALNGSCKFLNENGIIPDYQVLLDPQAFLVDYIGEAKEYLVASQCHPSVLKKLPDAILWHLAVEGAEEQLPPHDDDFCLVGGGITVGLSSMCLVYAMGYRKLHCYGYDSSYEDDGSHAYDVPVTSIAKEHPTISGERVAVTANGKRFISTLCLVKQAQNFPKLCDDLIDRGCLITVDCGGLLRAVVDENNRLNAAKAA